MNSNTLNKIHITLGQKITACVLVMQVIVILMLSAFVITRTSLATEETAIRNMQTVTQERAQIVRNHVKQIEEILTAYSRAIFRRYCQSGRAVHQRLEFYGARPYKCRGCGNHYQRGRFFAGTAGSHAGSRRCLQYRHHPVPCQRSANRILVPCGI